MARAGRADLQAYSVFSFGGVDVKTSPLKRAASTRTETLTKARNCTLSTAGAITKRGDTAAITTSLLGALNTVPHVLTRGLGGWTTLSDTRFLPTAGFLPTGHAAAITGGVEFVRSNGTRTVVFGADDGAVYKYNGNGTSTAIITGLTTGTKWYFATYNDKLIFCNRADAPRKWDGTTVSLLGGSPPAKGGPVAVHGNRVHFLDGTTKSRWTWSALNAEEDYTTANNAGFADISPNDGSDAKDLVPSINELVIIKGARPYRVQGTSPSTFTIANVVPTAGSVGAVSTQAALFALNDVWYLGNPGLVRLTAVQGFGDLRESFPSAPIQPYFEPGTPYTLALKYLDRAVMTYDSQHNRIYVGVDSNNDGLNDTMLVYDGATKGWTVWDSLSIASLWPVKNAVTGETDIYMGGYDGHIRVLNQATVMGAYVGEATHLSALGQPGIEKSLRHLYLYLQETGNFTLEVDLQFDFGPTQTIPVSMLGSSHTLGLNWVLGQDMLGVRDQVVKRLNVHGSGEFLALTVRNAESGQTFTWYGFEALFRSNRVVRRGTAVEA